ncbi:MAG: hypothetical protein RDU14_17345 [Melioribacteraceae bacterium]|nr:hypothetical protein [Melioribacteraceae bacterium]
MSNNVEVLDVHEINSNPTDLIQSHGLMQVKAQYTTAIQVVKKRDLNQVIASVENEAAIAGEEFFYNYPQGGNRVEGIAIGGALIIARVFGNCAINTRPIEYADKYIVHADFVDFETGFNLTRSYMGKKKTLKNKSGKAIYEPERNDEIVYQIITSKAIRNVVSNGVPKYLITKGIAAAKSNIRKKLEQMGKEKAVTIILKRAEEAKIPVDRVEENFGKKDSWDIDKMIMVIGAIRMVEEGYGTINDAFPKGGLPETEEPEDQKNEQSPEQSKAESKNPEVQSVLTDEKKKPEPIALTPEDWENPIKVIAKIESITDPKELASFKKENKNKLQAFSGKDHDAIQGALTTQEQKTKNGH